MKKLLLSFSLILFVQLISAQIVITSAYNLSIGDTYKYDGYEEVTNIEPGPAGANQAWDFSNIEGTGFYEGVGDIVVDPGTTPFADSAGVAGANVCVKNIGDEDSGPYQYFDQDNSAQDLLAMGFVGDGNSSLSTYTDELTAMEYPFAYNDTYSDTWESWGFNVNWGFYFMHDSAEVEVIADAWGTVTTAMGTYQNALRVKRTTTYWSWMRFIEEGDWIANGPFTDIDYLWFAPDIKVPVIIISDMENFENYSARIMDEYNFPVSVQEKEKDQLEIYPNPVAESLHISGTTEIKSIYLSSLNGQCLETIEVYSNTTTLNLFNYPAGLVLVQVNFADGSIEHHKIIKN